MFKITTKKLVVISIMMALAIIFKTFAIGNGQFRISIWDIPLMIAGIIAGPFYGGLCALGADLIYSFCFSSFPFSFIMMFTTIVWGIAGGIFYKRKIKIWVLVLVVLVTSFIATGINSIYLTMYYGWQTMLSGLLGRVITMLIKIPITTMIVYGIMEVLYKKLEYTKW